MKKLLTFILFLFAFTASAADREPTIEINIDVIQDMMPKPKMPCTHVPVSELMKPAPQKAPAKSKKHHVKRHKKQKVVKPVVGKELDKPEVKKEVAAPVIPPVVVPRKPVEIKQPVVRVSSVSLPSSSSSSGGSLAVKVLAPAPAISENKPDHVPYNLNKDPEQHFYEMIDPWLIKLDTWENDIRQWFAKKQAVIPATQQLKPATPAAPAAEQPKPVAPLSPVAAPAVVKPAPVAATIIEPAKVTPVEIKPVAPIVSSPAIPATTAVKPVAPVQANKSPLILKPQTESDRFQQKVDVLLLELDDWINRHFPSKTAEKPAVPVKAANEAPKPVVAATPVPAAAVTTPEATPAPTPAAAPAAPVAAPAAGEKPLVTPVLYTVLFAVGEEVVARTDIESIRVLAQKLQNDKEIRIMVLGYATPIEGKPESEVRKLSLKRAITVRELLISRGIDPARINVRALGSDTQEVVKDRVDIIRLR